MSALLNLALDERQSQQRLLLQAPTAQRMTASAQVAARRASNPLVGRQAQQVLNELEQTIYRLDVTLLQPLHVVETEDGSLLFEWILPGRRASVALDPVPSQSGWYLLADDAVGKQQEWGDLSTLDWAKLINHMVAGNRAK